MKNYEKETLKNSLEAEQKEMKRLQAIYKKAAQDASNKIRLHNGKISVLLSQFDELDEQQKSILQSQIYQKQFQESLKKQLDDILKDLQDKQYKSISEYLKGTYEDGFTSAMYSIHKQGIPIITPIDQKQVVRAMTIDSKISKGLYSRLGEDVARLKQRIANNISRGVATADSYANIARNIANGSKIGFNNAMRITRTEGNRIANQAKFDASAKAKEKGADVLKQWDAALDGKTRPHHRQLDGQIRELEEPFEVAGMKPMHPSDFGRPEEDINCRCTMLQRARWALDDDELETLKERSKYFELDKTEDFNDFKKKYLKLPENANTIEVKPKRVPNAFSEKLEKMGVKYKQIMPHKQVVTEEEIIFALAGGDRTMGSCASVGLAYCGQKSGYNVLDFRDGDSRRFFSALFNLRSLSELKGLKTHYKTAKSSVTAGNQLLKQVEKGKEYYLVCGRHAAIVRRTDEDVLQFLELQSATRSGWTNFNGNPRYTLKDRFGETKGYEVESFMIEVDSFKDNEVFNDILGYINTAETEQRKGSSGTIK